MYNKIMNLPEKDKRIWSKFFQGVLIYLTIGLFIYIFSNLEDQKTTFLEAFGIITIIILLWLWIKYCIDSTNER